MSSTVTPPSTTVDRITFWCHECDMSITLLSPATATANAPLLCPHCHSDFLEEMDTTFSSSNPNPNPNPNPHLNSDSTNPSPSASPIPILNPFLSPPQTTTSTSHLNINPSTTFPFPPTSALDDNFLLDSPYLHRLIQYLSNPDPLSTTSARRQSPTLKSTIESIPTVKFTSGLLEIDPIILCAICKDQFFVDNEAKELPCKHLYHADCILPWLETHNSCPVCRFKLPSESDGDKGLRERRRRERQLGRLSFGDVMMEDEEGFSGFASTLRHIARRHRMVSPPGRQTDDLAGVEEGSVLLSPMQIGEAEIGVVERTSSVETVSSWPVEVGLGGAGSGNGEIGVIERLNDDGSTVRS